MKGTDMDDDTSTVSDVQATENVEVSPVKQDDTSTTDEQVVTEPSGTQQDDDTGSTATAPDTDEKLRKYAANQGIELDSPGAIKAAGLAMKNQAEKTRAFQKSSELERAATDISDTTVDNAYSGQDSELVKRLQRVETKEMVRDFWNQEDIDKAYEPAMIEILKSKPYLAGDLESLYAVAVQKSGGIAAVKSQGKREALESLAHNQQAAVPTGSATMNGSPKKKEFKDLSIAEMEKQLGFAKRG